MATFDHLLGLPTPPNLVITHRWEDDWKGRKEYHIMARVGRRIVGYTILTEEGRTKLYPMDIGVNKAYQRRGIATAMYRYGQSISGRKVRPSGTQTDAAKAFWKNLKIRGTLR